MSSTITIVGNVTRDPELKFLNNGSAACKFSVAVNRKRKDKEDEVSFFTCDAYGEIAENCATSLTKGTRVVVHGSLVQRDWEKDDGTKAYVTEIRVEAVGPDLRFATALVTKSQRAKEQPRAYEGVDDYAF